MEVSGKFTIEKQAKSKGGDKYTGILSNGIDEELTRIYLPQTVSRHQRQKPSKIIVVRISLGNFARKVTNDDKENADSVLCNLTKAAKAKGGDRYDGKINDEVVSLYISQTFTRVALSANTSSRDRPFQRMLISFSRPNDAQPKSRPQSPIAATSLGKRSRQMSLPQSSTSNCNATTSRVIDIDVEAEFDEYVETQPDLILGKTVHLGSTTALSDHTIETNFEAFEEKRRDDSIIESICDASGCFDLDLYFRMKMD